MLAKIRKMLYEEVNQMRSEKGLQQFYLDMIQNEVANDYASFLKDNEADSEKYQAIMESHHVIRNEKTGLQTT